MKQETHAGGGRSIDGLRQGPVAVGTAGGSAKDDVLAGDLYRRIVERIDDGLIVCDLGGEVLVVNEAISALTGLSRDEWLSSRLDVLGLPETVGRHLLEAGTEGTAFLEAEILTKGKSLVPVLISATRAAYGRREVVYVVVRDARESKRAERAARENEQLVQGVLQSIPVGIHLYRLESDGRLVFMGGNQAADRILGLDHRQFLGKTIEEAFPGLRGTEIPARYREVAETGAPWSGRQVAYEDQKIRGAFEVNAFRVGENRMVAVFADVTDRHQIEERLRHAEKMEIVGQLTGGVVHDFNNQLTAIMGYADLLVLQLDDPELRGFASTILAAAKRSSQLTHQLLSYIRKHASQSVPVQVHSILDEVFTVLEHSADKRIVLAREFKAVPCTTQGDPSLLQNAFLNLAINACDAMPTGGTLTVATDVVAIDASRGGDGLKDLAPGLYILVQVRDTGTGMTPETRQQLFTPFFTTKGKGKGTGLGLASVRASVKLHAGAIAVESEVGNGSAFTVYLPMVEGVAAEDRDRVTAFAGADGVRVLVVDDEEIVRNLVCRMLKRVGHTVICEADGVAAVERYRASWKDLDIVLLDINLPRISGRDAFMAMREINPGLKALMFSGFGLTSDMETLLVPGEVEFLSKPFRQAEMYDRVLSLLRRKS
jgi:PAS domain S-box-containing protein